MDMFEDKYKEKSPFKMPDGYFDSFEERMKDRIEEEERPNKTKIGNVIKTYMWLVATFVLVFGIGKLIIPLVLDPSEKIQAQATQQMAVVETSDESEIVLDELDELDISDELIIEYLAEQEGDNNYIIAELK
jgi:flagellar biosynthesis/type III secretory pathway M-ring protein FliF/YscJ